MTPTEEDLKAAPTLRKLFQRYGLHYGLLPGAIRASGLGSFADPADEMLETLSVKAGTPIRTPLARGGS